MSAADYNQPPPFEGRNLYLTDGALQRAVAREGAAWAHDRLAAWGEILGRGETFALAARANRFAPELRTHDRFGNRIDEVVFDPAWHELMRLAMREGEHCAPWAEQRPGAQVARAAGYLLHAEVENGTQCPLTMTYAAVPVLERYSTALPALGDVWLPRVLAREYDPRALPVTGKLSALIGMGMTERQGGSDCGPTSRAPSAVRRSYRLTGFVVLLRADGRRAGCSRRRGACRASSCAPARRRKKNAVRIPRLKDKLGNRSMPRQVGSRGATASLLGEEGRGVPVIIEMVRHAARLRDRQRGHRARGGGAGAASRAAPARIRAAAHRAAADAERAGRSRHRGRSRDRARIAAGACVRIRRGRGPSSAGRSRLQP